MAEPAESKRTPPAAAVDSRDMTRLSVATALAGLILGVAAPRTASAFCRTTTCDPTLGECTPLDAPGCYSGGKPLVWTSRCVGFSVAHAAGPGVSLDAFQATANAAFATWQAVSCDNAPVSLSFTDNGVAACDRVEYNDTKPNAHVILFRRDVWPYMSATSTIALTTVTFDRDTGEILDADMELNAIGNTFTTADTAVDADLQSIITHEAGHFIGFSHSSVHAATMYFSYEKGSTSLRHLDADDVAIACLAYPPKRVAGCDASPKNGFSPQCASEQPAASVEKTGCGCRTAASAPTSLAWVAALGAIAALRRRRLS